MPLRNGQHGYGWPTKLLHWLTVALLATQLVVGLTMDADGPAERAETAAEAREDAAKDADDEQAEDAADAEANRAEDTDYLVGLADGVDPIDVHVALGASIMLLGLARLVWRRVAGLPPWSAALSRTERTVESTTEKVLLAGLFLVPSTGIALVLAQDDDLVPLHVGALVLLGLAVSVHVGLVLRRRLLPRMLPGG